MARKPRLKRFDTRPEVYPRTKEVLRAMAIDFENALGLDRLPKFARQEILGLGYEVFYDIEDKMNSGLGIGRKNRYQIYVFYRDWLYEHNYFAEAVQLQLLFQEYWKWIADHSKS